MDYYFDCPCGHAHHEHDWSSRASVSSCDGHEQDGSICECWTYHGHRVGDEPHYVIREGLVKPTAEMRADHKVQEIMMKLWRKETGI